MGNCENLLKAVPLAEVFDLSVEQVCAIEGFAELSAQLIVEGLKSIRVEFEQLMLLGFNLESTAHLSEQDEGRHPLFGKKIVFTGKMAHNRDEMKKQAKALGIQVASAVSGSTDFLVIGEQVGQSKLDKAKAHGVDILTEQAYWAKLTIT